MYMYIHAPMLLREPDGFLDPRCGGGGGIIKSTEFGDVTKSSVSHTYP